MISFVEWCPQWKDDDSELGVIGRIILEHNLPEPEITNQYSMGKYLKQHCSFFDKQTRKMFCNIYRLYTVKIQGWHKI